MLTALPGVSLCVSALPLGPQLPKPHVYMNPQSLTGDCANAPPPALGVALYLVCVGATKKKKKHESTVIPQLKCIFIGCQCILN